MPKDSAEDPLIPELLIRFNHYVVYFKVKIFTKESLLFRYHQNIKDNNRKVWHLGIRDRDFIYTNYYQFIVI